MTPEEPTEYGCILPPGIHDDPPRVASYWRMLAHQDGFLTDGEPRVEKREPVNFGTPEEPIYMDVEGADQPLYVAYGAAHRAPAKPLPVFVPSEHAVAKAAEALFQAAKTSRTAQEWQELPAHVKNYYMRAAVSMFTAASGHLVADALQHASDHRDDYGLPTGLGPVVANVRARIV